MVEAVKMADGRVTVVSDYDWPLRTVKAGKTPEKCEPLWEEPCVSAVGKGVEFTWRRRDQSLGSRLAHQLARDAVRGAVMACRSARFRSMTSVTLIPGHRASV